MTGIPDAWGSPGYHLLMEACARAEACHEAYERRGRPSDLEQAVAGFSAVLTVAVSVDIRSTATNGLGVAMWSRYELLGELSDLDAAVELFHAALAMYPNEVTIGTPSFRANLGGALYERWRRTRSEQDLTEAMEAGRAALSLTSEGNSRRWGRVNQLAAVLVGVYVHHGDSSALTEAIDLYRQAVECAPAGSDGVAWTRSNLAEALRLRFQSVGDRDRRVLDEAVEQARAVVAATPATRPLRPRFQSNLALILVDRYAARGRPSDLAEAARLAEDAVRATPADHPNRVERLCILSGIRRMHLTSSTRLRAGDPRRPDPVGAVLGAGYDRPTRRIWPRGRGNRRPVERAALKRVARAAHDAAAAAPAGHLLWADALVGHGAALALTAAVDGDPNALERAIGCFRQVAENPTAPARARVGAAWQWAIAELARTGGSGFAAAMEPFELAVTLLPQTAPRRVTHADRERQLAGFAGLARDAAACAAALGEPERAVRLLEHGRGVLLSQALSARTEVTDLYEREPDLARRFEELRDALDRPEGLGFTAEPVTRNETGRALPGEDRHALAAEWELLLERIRGRPGFAHFLRPPRVSDLLSATAGRGPVVVVNVSGLRCDAFLLDGGQVGLLPLRGLTLGEVARRADEFRSATAAAGHPGLPDEVRAAARETIRETLEWLWTEVAEPVLAALGVPARQGQGQGLPRMWWVPTGPLTVLPLHAAGRYDAPETCVPDRAVSSYAPTVGSLVSAWRQEAQPRAARGGPPAPLVVSVPAAPGLPELRRVRDETATLVERFPGSRLLADGQAVRQAVLDALPDHRWTHFACHAVSTADGAEAGQLMLHDHARDPLTVTDLARLRLPDAELAYLSACETGVSREDLADEALHIAGACHMAGFRHVVGTLWAVRDDVAARVAADFYAALAATDAVATGGDAARAAVALHTAVSRVRAASPGQPALWAQFVHVGP